MLKLLGALVLLAGAGGLAFSQIAGQQERLNALGGNSYSPLAGDYFMVNCTGYPSVIVECGFLSNAADEALLVNEAYRARLADTICAGTLAYLAAASSGEGAFG